MENSEDATLISEGLSNTPMNIWIINGTAISVKGGRGTEYVLKSSSDKEIERYTEWYEAVIDSNDWLHRKRFEQILKPIREVMDGFKKEKITIVCEPSSWKFKMLEAIKKTLSPAGKEGK